MDTQVDIELSRTSNLSTKDDDKFAIFTINSELFINISNRIFDTLHSILFFILLCFLISNSLDYNLFPFEVNDANSWLYQLAQFIFLISFWAKEILILRILLICGYLLFIITFSNDSISIDFLVYSIISITLNLKNIFELLYRKRKITFDTYREQIYEEMFSNFMKRDEFLILSKLSLIRDLQPGAHYCHIGDKSNNLAILLNGKLQLIGKDPNKQIFIEDNEFIDSAEWILRNSNSNKGKRFNYNIKAINKSTYLFWPREILLEKLKEHPELHDKLLGVLGLDVSHKILLFKSLI